MRTKDFTQDQINEIINLYLNENLSTISIGKKFNIGKEAINKLLRKHNVNIRTAAEGIFKGGKAISNKKYREKEGYKETQKEYMKNYYPTYSEENKEKLKEKSIKYYYDNYEKNREIDKEYYKNNKEKIKEYREKYKIRRNELHKERMKTDYLYKLKHNIRGLIKQGFKTSTYIKVSKTQNILGCLFEEFKIHLELKFEPWMTWDNMGNPKDGIIEPNKTWDIDHVIPTSSATTEEELLKLNHFSNLQPLCSYHNRFIKRNN